MHIFLKVLKSFFKAEFQIKLNLKTKNLEAGTDRSQEVLFCFLCLINNNHLPSENGAFATLATKILMQLHKYFSL